VSGRAVGGIGGLRVIGSVALNLPRFVGGASPPLWYRGAIVTEASTTGERTSTLTLLSAMMFLQFFLWGAWFVTLGPFMGATGFGATDIGNAYTTAPVAAILAPLFLGMVADRFFASEKVMGVLHLAGGAILCFAPMAAETGNAWLFVGVLFAHMLCYMPTLGLSNTIAFNAISNPEKSFPLVRVWGTIGWIVAGFVVGILASRLTDTSGMTDEAAESARAGVAAFFYVAGGSGVLLGLLSFVLPHTPAPMRGKPVNIGSVLGFDALRLMSKRSFAVFMVCSLLICIPLAAYYQQAANYATDAGVSNVPIKMTFGQMSEILFMLVMPLLFVRMGVKWMLAVGMLAWVLRYGLFAGAWSLADEPIVAMILLGIVLHGICYDFFFVAGQIYTEQTAPKQMRAQAQGLLVLVTQGVGMLIGNQVFARLVAANTSDTPGEQAGVAWDTVWMIPAGFAFLVLVVFVLLFKDDPNPEAPENESLVDPGPAPDIAGGATT
jgi:nucleoside transporter